MNQEKIGKFIQELRKEKNMTQLQLAEKLGVTDRAISNWENGRRMPDLSLIKLLCDDLGVSINDLLSGEIVDKDIYQDKFEENIMSTIDYTNKKIKRNNLIFKIIIASVIAFFISLITVFCIDINRMKNNQPVFFSTWGFDYTHPISLRDKEIEIAIEDYLIDKTMQNGMKYENEKDFVSMNIFLIEERNEFTLFNVYAWVLEETYYKNNDNIIQNSGSSIPYKFVVELIDDKMVVTDSRIPRDGSYYSDDLKNIFPSYVRQKIGKVHENGIVDMLMLEIQQEVALYFSK